MPRFLAVMTGSAEARERSGFDILPDADREAREMAGRAAWGQWMQVNAHRLVDGGGPLGVTKRVDPNGVADASNNLAAFVLFEADSHEEAAALFIDHPHFAIFPGEAVEVMPVLPVPGA
ncbi:MAG: hypothetical protein R3E84_01120 [Pseudomonadales bacterium]